ncbi:MAG TPA: O-antigen ligase family protein [Chloroflexaceae bacterium]|nr:O-antigen ligase family protein [Chloroflexaceae bacterium]
MGLWMRSKYQELNGPFQSLLLVVAGLLAAVPVGIAVASGGDWLVVVGLVVVAATIVMLIVPELATLVFSFVLYINGMAIATNIYGVPNQAAGSFFLILSIPLAHYIFFRRQPVIFVPVMGLMALWLVVMILSGIVSQTLELTQDAIFLYVTEGMILFILVLNAIRTPEMLRRIIWVLLLSGAIMGGLSLYQDLTNTYDNNYWGLAQVDEMGIFEIGQTALGDVDRKRLGGPIGSENRYAQIMLVLFPLAVFRYWGEREPWLRALAALCALLIVAGMALTFSRGAAVALVGLLVLMVVWRYIKISQALVLCLALGLFLSVMTPDYFFRLVSLREVSGLVSSEEGDPDGALRGRFTSNMAAIVTFAEHPILGVGPGAYFRLYSQSVANELGLRFLTTNRRAHNLYLEIAADTGIVGLVTFLSIPTVTVLGLWRTRRRWLTARPEYANMATALILALAGYMATAVFLHLSYQRYFWFLLALAHAAIVLYQREPEAASPHDPQDATGQAVAAGHIQ